VAGVARHGCVEEDAGRGAGPVAETDMVGEAARWLA
jgi:hypothetical protein